MSTKNTVKINELTPNTQGDLTLIFEVVKVVQRSQDGEAMTCSVADETGIITAYFNQYSKFITEGNTFEIQNFRCKVVDHYLRLQMLKTTIVSKQPFIMGFKDMKNDLSRIFYKLASKSTQPEKVQRPQHSKQQVDKIRKADIKSTQKSSKTENKKDEKLQDPKHKKIDQVKKQKQNYSKVQEERQRKKSQNEIQKIAYVQKKQYQKEEFERKNHKETNDKKQKSKERRKYVEKGETQNGEKIQSKKIKFVPRPKQIKLTEMGHYQEEPMSFFVRVNLKTAIEKESYLLCKVSDSSGSTYFEFQPKMYKHFLDGSWYKLIGFKIYGDRDYKFIASQQENSSYELVEDCEQTADYHLLWR